MVRTQREPEGKKEPSEIKETREKERRGEEKPRVRLGEERERERSSGSVLLSGFSSVRLVA